MNRGKTTKKSHKIARWIGRVFAVIGVTLLALLLLTAGACYLCCNGPSPTARNIFVNTMQETSALKFVPHLFLSNEEVEQILNGNSVVETDVSTNSDTEFEKHDETIPLDTIELLDVSGSSFVGKMMIVHDPSRLHLACLPKFSDEVDGMTVEKFASKNKAIAAINGGGFSDENGFGSGGLPTGIVIRDGKLLFGSAGTVSSVIGFDNENHLIVGKMSANEALKRGIRDALSFGPAFIVNGEAMEVSGTSGGLNPRTVIGQRADGAVLMLVIDGRQPHSLGATYKDCIDLMLQYGAVNAANLDGGCSTTMVYNGDIVNSCSTFYGSRYIPTAFIVK